MAERGTRSPRAAAGQAQLELLAMLPLLLAVALVTLQLLLVGYAQSLADGSAEAGAIAQSSGEPAEAAARAALPGWVSRRVQVESAAGRVSVRIAPPALLPGLGGRIDVASSAWSRPAGATG